MPIGVLVALFTSEIAIDPRGATFVRLMLDILNGVPSVVIGIFVFGLLVVGHGQAAWIAGVALAIVEVPLIARSTQEVLGARTGLAAGRECRARGPHMEDRRPGGHAVVARRDRHRHVARGRRVAGETAPIIFASSLAANVVSWDPNQAVFTLPYSIFIYSESPDPTTTSSRGRRRCCS